MAENTLRQAENQVYIEGILKEKRIEEKEINGKVAITGELDIEVKENEVHTINLFSYKYKKDSDEESGIYKGLKTVMDDEEYKAINKVGVEAADRVRVTAGQIGLNEYYRPDGNLSSFPKISSNFFNRVTDINEFEPRAEFRAEVVVAAVKEEMDKEGNETGRAVLDTYIPLYGGRIIPFSFVVSEDGAGYVQDNYERGQTVKVWGDIVNFREVIEQNIEGAFGTSDKKVTTNFKREYVITGGSEPYEEENVNAYNPEMIKKALTEREIRLEEMKNKSNKKSNSGGGAKTGFDVKPKSENPFGGGGIDISDDDLPF